MMAHTITAQVGLSPSVTADLQGFSPSVSTTIINDPRPAAPASLRVVWANGPNDLEPVTDPTAMPAQPASLTHTAKP